MLGTRLTPPWPLIARQVSHVCPEPSTQPPPCPALSRSDDIIRELCVIQQHLPGDRDDPQLREFVEDKTGVS